MMKRALTLARRGIGKTSPNPAVGCVIVKDGTIVGEGWHRKAGTPHAEVHALVQAGQSAHGADVYVTLEPCSHHGKTPPCADALVEAGVARVFIGMVDPNPQVSGRGINKLRSAGIEVVDGILGDECRAVIEPFIKYITTGLPFVILKSAMTMDGKTATSSGESKWITNEKSREYVHKLRSMVDAVMVGVGTIIADNPQLTTRLPRGGRDPLRVIVDSTLRTPMDARVLLQSSAARTMIATISKNEDKSSQLQAHGAEIVRCREKDGRVDLGDLLKQLGSRGIQSVLLEGGRELAGEALRLRLIDKYIFFYAPKLFGGADGFGLFAGQSVSRMNDALMMERIAIRKFGNDVMIEAYPEGKCSPGL